MFMFGSAPTYNEETKQLEVSFLFLFCLRSSHANFQLFRLEKLLVYTSCSLAYLYFCYFIIVFIILSYYIIVKISY